jgi:hypothetical protein
MPKPYVPLCFVTSIVHNTWSTVKHLHRTRNHSVPCNTSDERTEMRRIIGTRTRTHGLFKTLKVQTLYTLSINAKSAPYLRLSYCSAVSRTQRKRFIWQKKCVFSECLEKLHAWNRAFLLLMFNMKAITVKNQSPLKSNYALCVGTTLRGYKTSTWVRVYKTPFNYLLSIEGISFTNNVSIQIIVLHQEQPQSMNAKWQKDRW